MPASELPQDSELAEALLELDRLVRRLRRECPWDREQDVDDIVGYALEETYELIDAAHAGDGTAVAGELGDLLFHIFFLSSLAQERGWGGLVRVARSVARKLILRHPHVFAGEHAGSPEEVVRRWEEIKRDDEGRQGIFHDAPASLPAALLARRLQGRAAAVGFDWQKPEPVIAKIDEELAELKEELAAEPSAAKGRSKRGPGTGVYHEVGDLLFAAVNLARKLDVDPELALRSAALRFQERVEAAASLAAAAGEDFSHLPQERQEEYYQLAKRGW